MTSKKKEGAKFIKYFGPLLDALRSLGGSARPAEASEKVATDLEISQKEQDELLPSGSPRFHNAVQWARLYLVREGLIDGSIRGVWALTPEGWKTHLDYQQSRTIASKWSRASQKARKAEQKSISPDDEDIDDAESTPALSYKTQVMEQMRAMPADAFERLCQRLLRESGFTTVTVTGKSGDGGIDGFGVLQINPFVSFRVLFQCKRYTGAVGSGHVRDFRGAMQGRADKGILITTGTFTHDARKEGVRDGAPPLELVDGEKLIEMFEHLEFGLKPRKTYEVDVKFFKSFHSNGC